MRKVLQEIIIKQSSDLEGYDMMFLRSYNNLEYLVDGVLENVSDSKVYDFSTYFNILSLKKWRKYTKIPNLFIELEAEGSFILEVIGDHVDRNKKLIRKVLSTRKYNLDKKESIVEEVSFEDAPDVIAFRIITNTGFKLYGGCYYTDIDEKEINDIFLTLITTTFKKEKFIENNTKILNMELFHNDEFKNKINWIIIDNGNTLDKSKIETADIKVFENKNVGGAGGFSRGIIEANDQERKPTHVLLMDDDVVFFADAFKRTYRMLELVKDEYKDYFICGAMLEMERRNIQHEDIGVTRKNGEHGPCKPYYDLNDYFCVVENEQIIPYSPYQYCGWWYCCMPTTIARNDNLPFPAFIRGDDIEYSFRNHAKFITLNGICIWHQGFEGKFSAAMEFYQVHRNDLILHSLHDHVQSAKIMTRINDLFWEELYKFNYKGANLLIDAIDDYLKGPEYIKSLDGERKMKEQKAKDDKLMDLTDDIKALYDEGELFNDEPYTNMQKRIYDYTYNGQLLPDGVIRGGVGVIPYGWGYYPGKQMLTSVNYAIDPTRKKYAIYKRSHKKLKEIKQRYENILRKYSKVKNDVVKAYKEAAEEWDDIVFWSGYLE